MGALHGGGIARLSAQPTYGREPGGLQVALHIAGLGSPLPLRAAGFSGDSPLSRREPDPMEPAPSGE